VWSNSRRSRDDAQKSIDLAGGEMATGNLRCNVSSGRRLPDFFQLALPNGKDPPTEISESLFFARVSFLIRMDLRHPIADVAGRRPTLTTLMPMPKTAVNKDYGFIFWECEVWRSGQPLVIDDVAKT
jgi:hypothetical protein